MSQLYKSNFKYHKAGIILLDVLPNTHRQESLFKPHNNKKSLLMATIDKINQDLGSHSIFFCAEGIKKPWQLKRDLMTARYTTELKELLKAHC